MLSFKVWLFTQSSFCGPQTAYIFWKKVNTGISNLPHLFFAVVSHKRPWNATAVFLDMIKELVTLALLLVVNHALLLVVRKLLEDFRPGHTLESAH